MKVKQSSWHFKAWKFMQDPMKLLSAPSVCSYWGTIFIRIPIGCIVIIAASPVILLVWMIEESGLEAWLKGKSFCPFGKVEIEP